MKKSTLITVVVFVILLAAVFLVNKRPMERGRELLSFTELDPESIDSLHIEATEEAGPTTVELLRDDGVWRLADGHLADPDAVQRALEGLVAVDTSDVVSTSSDRHATYGVDREQGLTLEAGAGGKRAVHLVIGKPGGGGAYLRTVGDDTVFQSSRGLRHLFFTDQKRWLKLKLVDATLAEVQRIELRLASGTAYDIVPVAAGDEWALADQSLLPADFRFDGSGARALASTVVSVRAKEIIDAADELATGLDGPHDRFTVISGTGSATIHLGAAADDSTVYAKVDGRDALFTVPAYQAKNLRKELTELRDLRLMEFAPEEVVGLSLHHDGASYRFTRNDQGLWEIAADGATPPADFAFDPSSVDRLLQSLAGLRATALADEEVGGRAGLSSPDPQVVLSLADGSTAELGFGSSSTDADGRTVYSATGNADARLYTVVDFQRGRFTRGWESFEVVEPPPNMGGNNPFANLDPETLKNLPPEVRESLLKQMQEQAQKERLMEQIRQREAQ